MLDKNYYMTEEECKVLDKFISWCHESSVVYFRDLCVYHKGYFNDTARGSRERFLIERKLNEEQYVNFTDKQK